LDSLLYPLTPKAVTIKRTNPSLSIVYEHHLYPDNSLFRP